MPELPEVEVLRRDLDKEIVGKKIKAVEVTGTRSVRRHSNKKEFIELARGPQDHVGAAARQVPRRAARRHRGARRAPRHVGSAAAREVGAREGAEAHARRDHVHAGRAVALRRPADVRRDVRRRSTTTSTSRSRSSRTSGSTRSRPRCRGSCSVACSPRSKTRLKTAADGPEVHRRDRQRVQRRDPVRRPASSGTA